MALLPRCLANKVTQGISFLGADKWATEYDLSLQLHRNAALAQYAQGRADIMTQRINDVLNHARCFDDKIDTINLLIHSLSMDAKSVDDAFKKTFWVLEQFGETFPTNPDNETIARELVEAKNQLEQYLPSTLSSIPQMEDPEKLKAMVRSPSVILFRCRSKKLS